MTALAYGVLLGGAAQLLLRLPHLNRNGFSYAVDFRFGHPALKRLLLLMGPATFGAAIYQINVLISTILASMLPQGSISYLYYADRLLQFPLGIFAVALGTAALPSFSSLVAKKAYAELKLGLAHTLGLVNFVSLPATLGLVVVAVPVFSILFQRGAFDAEATIHTSRALAYYALGLWGISGTKLVVPVFYAMEDTRTPVLVAFLSFVLNLVLSLMLMGSVPAAPDDHIIARFVSDLSRSLELVSLSYGGLALATSISSTFQFLLLLWILHRRLGGFPFGEFMRSFLLSLANSILMALPLFWLVSGQDWVGPEKSMLNNAFLFVFLIGLGFSLYLCLSYLFRSPEWAMVRTLGVRITRR